MRKPYAYQPPGRVEIPNPGSGVSAFVQMQPGAGRCVRITDAHTEAQVSINIDLLREALDMAERLLNEA
jgi:hypothetical protein